MEVAMSDMGFDLSDEEQASLSAIACNAIEGELARRNTAVPKPEEDASGLNPTRTQGASGGAAPRRYTDALRAPAGAFVTLHSKGRLRGCIGSMLPREPLYMTVSHMARAAAFQDPRFPPLRPEEWPGVSVEISVLSPLTRCPDPQLIEVGRHGLLLVRLGSSGVFLPQVPVEQGWDRDRYLENLCVKAGLPQGSWKEPDAELYWFEALVFEAGKP
jgi:AmmeMemoRadiSam system protein A